MWLLGGIVARWLGGPYSGLWNYFDCWKSYIWSCYRTEDLLIFNMIWGNHRGEYRPTDTQTRLSFSFSVRSLIHGGPWVCCLNEDECKESICTFPTPSGSSALHHQLTHQLGNTHTHTHTHTPPTSAVCSLPLNSELPEPAWTRSTPRAQRCGNACWDL